MQENTILDDEVRGPGLDSTTVAKINYWIEELNEQIKYIRQTRNVLILILLIVIISLLSLLFIPSPVQLGIRDISSYVLVVLAFASCVIFIYQSPFIAIVIGLIIFFSGLLPNLLFINQFSSVGIIFRLIILIFLLKGLYGATQSKRILVRLKELGAPNEIEELVRRLKKIDRLRSVR